MKLDREYAKKLSAEHLLENEEVLEVGEHSNGYGETYLVVQTTLGARLVFDIHTHKYLWTEEA